MKYVMIMVILISIFFIGCPPADNGGEGADFDATQYYTKTEVDALIAENRTAVWSSYMGIEQSGIQYEDPLPMPRAGIIKNIYIYTTETVDFSGSVTVTFTINEIDSTLTFPITTGSASISYPQDGTLAFAAGDICRIRYDLDVQSAYKAIFLAFEY